MKIAGTFTFDHDGRDFCLAGSIDFDTDPGKLIITDLTDAETGESVAEPLRSEIMATDDCSYADDQLWEGLNSAHEDLVRIFLNSSIGILEISWNRAN